VIEVSNGTLIWWMRAGVVVVVLLASAVWFHEDPFNGLRVTVLALIALPWLVALCLPASKFQHAFGLLAGSSLMLIPVTAMLVLLAHLSQDSAWVYWLLTFAMALTLLIGLIISIGELRRGQVFATAAIVAICSLLYEGVVLKVGPELARHLF